MQRAAHDITTLPKSPEMVVGMVGRSIRSTLERTENAPKEDADAVRSRVRHLSIPQVLPVHLWDAENVNQHQ